VHPFQLELRGIIYIFEKNISIQTLSYTPGLKTLLLHGHSLGSLLPDVAEEAHLRATVGCSQSGSVVTFHVDAAAIFSGLPRCPRDFLGLKRSEIGAPVHVPRGASIVRAVHPKIVQNTITYLRVCYKIYKNKIRSMKLNMKINTRS